jgi:hypothetical protein
MHKKTLSFVALFLSALMSGCGGGSAGSNPAPPTSAPLPSFTLTLSASTINLAQGGPSQSFNVSIAGQNGFADTVTVAPVGLFNGVSVSPSSLTLTAGTSGTLRFLLRAQLPFPMQALLLRGLQRAPAFRRL